MINHINSLLPHPIYTEHQEGQEEVALRIFGTKYYQVIHLFMCHNRPLPLNYNCWCDTKYYQLFPFVFERLPSFYLHVSATANDDDDDRYDDDHDGSGGDDDDDDDIDAYNDDDDSLCIIILIITNIIITYHHALDFNRTLQVTNRKICASTAGACPYNS